MAQPQLMPMYEFEMDLEEVAVALRTDQLAELAREKKMSEEAASSVRGRLSSWLDLQTSQEGLPPETGKAAQAHLNTLVFVMRRFPELPKEEQSDPAEELGLAALIEVAKSISTTRPEDRANLAWETNGKLVEIMGKMLEKKQIDLATFVDILDGLEVDKRDLNLIVWKRNGAKIKFPKGLKERLKKGQ